jgi:hypothetical protein
MEPLGPKESSSTFDIEPLRTNVKKLVRSSLPNKFEKMELRVSIKELDQWINENDNSKGSLNSYYATPEFITFKADVSCQILYSLLYFNFVNKSNQRSLSPPDVLKKIKIEFEDFPSSKIEEDSSNSNSGLSIGDTGYMKFKEILVHKSINVIEYNFDRPEDYDGLYSEDDFIKFNLSSRSFFYKHLFFVLKSISETGKWSSFLECLRRAISEWAKRERSQHLIKHFFSIYENNAYHDEHYSVCEREKTHPYSYLNPRTALKKIASAIPFQKKDKTINMCVADIINKYISDTGCMETEKLGGKKYKHNKTKSMKIKHKKSMKIKHKKSMKMKNKTKS